MLFVYGGMGSWMDHKILGEDFFLVTEIGNFFLSFYSLRFRGVVKVEGSLAIVQ